VTFYAQKYAFLAREQNVVTITHQGNHIKTGCSIRNSDDTILARYPFRNYLFIIVPQKHGSFSATIRQNGLSRAKTAIVPEKSCNSSATMKPKPPRWERGGKSMAQRYQSFNFRSENTIGKAIHRKHTDEIHHK